MCQSFLLPYKTREKKISLIPVALLSFLGSYPTSINAHRSHLNGIKNLSFKINAPNSLKYQTSKGLHIVLFYRTGCPYCLDFLPVYKELAAFYRGRAITFGAVEMTNDYTTRMDNKGYIEEHYQDHSKQGGLMVNTFPCIIIVLDGKIVEVVQGSQEAREPSNLKRLINSYLN